MTGEQEIRCFCSHKPLLAVCGRDSKDGTPYIHIKAYKANRLITEVVVTSGTVQIHCRECLRWYKVRIVHMEVDVKNERLPESIRV